MTAATTTLYTNPGRELELRFERIFNEHNQSVYQLALKVIKSGPQACDIMQDVFVKLWEIRDQWEEIRNMEAWLHRVTRNRLIDVLRKVAADQRLQDKLWKRVQDEQTNTEAELDAKESATILQQIINELPPQRKLVYLMSREQGLNYNEIAEELSVSKHTVKNQLSLALRFLQKKLSLE